MLQFDYISFIIELILIATFLKLLLKISRNRKNRH